MGCVKFVCCWCKQRPPAQNFVRKLILEFLVECFPSRRENKIIPIISHLLVLMIVHICVVTLICGMFCERMKLNTLSKKILHVIERDQKA